MDANGPGTIRRIAPTVLRSLVVLSSLVVSVAGVLFATAGIAQMLDEGKPLSPWMIGYSLMMCYAWIAWLVLAYAWIVRRRLHLFWPISGLVTGSLSVLSTLGLALLYVFPAFVMAVLFVIFQFDRKERPDDAVTRSG